MGTYVIDGDVRKRLQVVDEYLLTGKLKSETIDAFSWFGNEQEIWLDFLRKEYKLVIHDMEHRLEKASKKKTKSAENSLDDLDENSKKIAFYTEQLKLHKEAIWRANYLPPILTRTYSTIGTI